MLGQILAESGRSEEAVASIDRTIAIDPAMASAWHPFAVNRTFTERDQSLVDRMLACLARPDLAAQQRRAVNFALGKAYGDLRD